MFAFRVVEQLKVLEEVLSGCMAGWVGSSSDAFALQQLHEAFNDRVIMTIPTAVHAGIKIVLAEKRLPFPTVKLRSLIQIHGNRAIWPAPPDGHQKCLKREFSCQTRLNRPTDHASRKR